MTNYYALRIMLCKYDERHGFWRIGLYFRNGVIHVSVFYADGRDDRVVRFCFAKQEETLLKAAELLCKAFVKQG